MNIDIPLQLDHQALIAAEMQAWGIKCPWLLFTLVPDAEAKLQAVIDFEPAMPRVMVLSMADALEWLKQTSAADRISESGREIAVGRAEAFTPPANHEWVRRLYSTARRAVEKSRGVLRPQFDPFDCESFELALQLARTLLANPERELEIELAQLMRRRAQERTWLKGQVHQRHTVNQKIRVQQIKRSVKRH